MNRVKFYILDTALKLIGSRQGRSFYALTWCTEHPGREAKQLLLFFSKIELFSLKKLGSRKSKNLWIHRIGSKTRSNFLGNETSWRILDLMSNLYQGKSLIFLGKSKVKFCRTFDKMRRMRILRLIIWFFLEHHRDC